MMKAEDFLGSKTTVQKEGATAEAFLEESEVSSMFGGGQPSEKGVGGDFPKESKWWHKPVEWLTAGHISHEPRPLPEVTRDPKTGEILIINEPESARMSIFEEPTGIPLAAAMFGAAGPAVSGVIPRALRGAREGIGWLTGGATEAPALAKVGMKAIPKLAEGVSAKQLEKTMAKAVEKPFGQVPEKIAAKEISTGVGAMPAKVIESEFLKGQFAERFLKGKPSAVHEPTKVKPVKEAKTLLKVKDGTAEGIPSTPKFIAASPKVEKDVTLHAGIPIHKAGKIWTKSIGEPVWDKAVMKGVPKLLEKVPGGKSINRAFLYDYRGDLPNTAKYIHSMEDMKRSQSIGREYAVDLGKRIQSLPEDAQLRMGEYIRGEVSELKAVHEKTLADEAKMAMLDLGRQAVDVGLLSEKTFFKNAGRYMPRLYTSKEYQGLLTRFSIAKPNRLDLSRFKKRKDIPKEIRKELGEILTPGYPVAKGISQLTHDIEMSRFFNGIAANKDWSVVKQAKISKKTGQPIGYKRTTYDSLTGKPIEHFGIQKEFTDKIPEGWKQLPPNKKLGNLSESYVHPEIFTDLQEAVRVMEMPEKVWRKTLGAWKYGKVIVSPKTHARNLLSNSVLAHLGGLPMYEQPVYLTKAAMAMRKKGEYWKSVKEIGGMEHTFTAGELNALFSQVEGQMSGIKAGGLAEKLGVVGNAWELSKKGLKKAADLYQAEEQWFKMAKFIHNVERKKMSHAVAWKDAEKWLFNYSKITKFQEKYRSKWYGAPFATFTFKALPRMAEAMIKTPWRFALPAAMIYGMEEYARKVIGDTKEQFKAKKELRPDWMKGQSLGAPNFARVPFVDDQGREYYLNLTYILPWGDIGEAGKFGPIPGGLMPFSQPFIKEPMQQIMNYDSFWDTPIVKEKDIAGKTKIGKFKTKAKIRGKHLAQTMLPTPVMDVTKVFDALKRKPDYRGRLKPPKIAAFDVIAGVKMYPVDYVDQVARKIGKTDPKAGWLARKIHGDIRTLSIKKKALTDMGRDSKFYDKQIEAKIKQLQGLAGESVEVGKLYNKLRK